MPAWEPHTILPEVLYENESQRDHEKDRQIIEMRDRIQRLENQLMQRQPGLSGLSIGGFELTPNVMMFGAIIGLVVYAIMCDRRVPARMKGWWE